MVEANRLMAFLLNHSPYVFWMYKTLVPTLGCALLWRYRKSVRWIHGAVVTVFAVYLTVVMRNTCEHRARTMKVRQALRWKAITRS